jgi:hypothetical protein
MLVDLDIPVLPFASGVALVLVAVSLVEESTRPKRTLPLCRVASPMPAVVLVLASWERKTGVTCKRTFSTRAKSRGTLAIDHARITLVLQVGVVRP